jgi:hypothetical protein
MRLLLILSYVLLFTSCHPDNFYEATKIIRIKDTIRINEPFDIGLILRNDSSFNMKFTIDTIVQKSLFFGLFFYCDKRLLTHYVDHPKDQNHKYNTKYLGEGDSLVYNLRACFKRQGNNLEMVIDGYERVYRVRETDCSSNIIYFGGEWCPGRQYLFDAMEGYNFAKEVVVID